MKKYKVIAISVGALNNKFFSAGDVVTENQFKPGRADELVKLGFLKEEKQESQVKNTVKENNSKQTVKDPEPVKNDTEPVQNSSVNSEDELKGDENLNDHQEGSEQVTGSENNETSDKKDILSIDDVTAQELKDELLGKGIPFKSNATKQELYDLWISHQE